VKRLAFVAALLVGAYLAAPAEAQGRFWVLVNGALRYNGSITVTGTQSVAGLTLTGASGAFPLTIQGNNPIITGVNPAASGNVLRAPNNVNLITVRNAANNADVNFVFLDTNNLWNIDPGASGILYTAKAFASLGTPANGAFYYCSDCTIASPCAGSGTGAFAKRLNATWVCN
jgi:hypothetical protein